MASSYSRSFLQVWPRLKSVVSHVCSRRSPHKDITRRKYSRAHSYLFPRHGSALTHKGEQRVAPIAMACDGFTRDLLLIFIVDNSDLIVDMRIVRADCDCLFKVLRIAHTLHSQQVEQCSGISDKFLQLATVIKRARVSIRFDRRTRLASCRLLVRAHSIPTNSVHKWHPGKSFAAVRYATNAWSDSSCAQVITCSAASCDHRSTKQTPSLGKCFVRARQF